MKIDHRRLNKDVEYRVAIDAELHDFHECWQRVVHRADRLPKDPRAVHQGVAGQGQEGLCSYLERVDGS